MLQKIIYYIFNIYKVINFKLNYEIINITIKLLSVKYILYTFTCILNQYILVYKLLLRYTVSYNLFLFSLVKFSE